ncbi:hypothetical protein J2855_004955 [Agrobacterium tumefaciens]|uniref:hypothetical protein n=1 Tax=Agrobacterium tumefaciens TaxID=358 RepID=UPI000DD0B55E|nr:hypothetical protein [Agrobacterium tumefaciens]MBP2511300.1 hypothetical protein [Agrobacterium tumefaciens]MBP2520569.1 hypothetical protein [Agrobacterium tumefaciens]MBP2579238.1 hypothetical protein [Agrobacterium tumefaciens]MBP2597531.1 hypothetical protein [Agrobacterium tumefaciens]
MKVAAKSHIVKRRIDDYVWRDNTLASRRLRCVLGNHFKRFDHVAIVGGMVRDFARVGKQGFKSDIDLVIDAPVAEVADMARSVNARTNVFGGHSITELGWSVDFWALESTWAIREGHVTAGGLTDFIRSTFFDYDAVLYDIKSRQVLHGDSYLDGLQRKVMEVNLLPNPTIIGNLYRAIRRILLWDLSAGDRLKSFIADNLDSAGFRDVVAMDNRKSSTPFLYRYKSATELREAVICRQYRRAMSTYYGEQLDLPGLRPVSYSSQPIVHQ